ncbi:uncharacterized protein LOC132732794 [Ruditapes philippinarum]|uniref:uncharacterized protein LOC132732794 n=1 Tax=Ruditapes philippinarum TaxID=129788 RepID=UPI00295AE0DE|nr:uncharacterized protein LOC132732794 [Ruditapes philippinarum]
MNCINACLFCGNHKRQDDHKMKNIVSKCKKIHPYFGENQASSLSRRKLSLRCHSPEHMCSMRLDHLLYFIAYHIDNDEFKRLKLILTGPEGISGNILEKCNTCSALFTVLKQSGYISGDNVSILLKVLHILRKEELKQLIEQYCVDEGMDFHNYKSGLAQPYVSHNQKLNEMWKKTGRNETIYEECEKICKLIENMSYSIFHVWPAYDTKANDDIVFVVLTKSIGDKLQVEEELGNIGYNIFVTNVDSNSNESEQVIKKQTKLKSNVCQFQIESMKNVINKHSDRLLQNHQYLSAISGSTVRSKNFSLGKSKHCVSVQSCIVLYVIAKGKVPLHENTFESQIDGIPVDVREGTFETTNLPSQKYFRPVKMGCQITSNKTSPSYGTLGGFYYHTDLGLCGITCAHVVLDEAEMHDLRGEKKIWNTDPPMVFQPDISRLKYQLGPVKEVVYKAGNDSSSGIDMAIFKLEGRAPNSGHFPAGPGLCFETGRTLGTSGLKHNTQVLKYGRTTELTRGYIEFENVTVRAIRYERRYTVNNCEYTYFLKNQIQIRPDISDFRPFNDDGDSGAFVFAKDTDNQLACIGMCVGKIDLSAVVIPISVIKEELGVSQLYDFRWNHISEKLKEIDREMKIRNNQQNKMDKKLDKILSKLSSSSKKK